MSEKKNSFLIGLFVLGAAALLLTGVVLFSSANFFAEKLKVVSFFNGSVKGLQVGASVTFRGVRIGQVEDVRIQLSSDKTLRIPVIMTIFPEQVSEIGNNNKHIFKSNKLALESMIDRGLTAQLEMESFVTGVLSVNLDFKAKSNKKLIGSFPDYTEIPTAQSSLEYLSSVFFELPISEITDDILSIVKNIRIFLESKDGKEIGMNLGESLSKFSETLLAGKKLINKIDTKIEPISSDLHEAVKQLKTTLSQAESTFLNVNDFVNPDTETGNDLRGLIEELKSASYKIKNLADYLERNPEALIKGKR